jgi:hypothetical protein
MTDDTAYTPPKIWTWTKESGGQFANINRPVAGPTHDKDLPVGRHPLQLYSLATPNGVKVTVMLEGVRSIPGATRPGSRLLGPSTVGGANAQSLRAIAY